MTWLIHALVLLLSSMHDMSSCEDLDGVTRKLDIPVGSVQVIISLRRGT